MRERIKLFILCFRLHADAFDQINILRTVFSGHITEVRQLLHLYSGWTIY